MSNNKKKKALKDFELDKIFNAYRELVIQLFQVTDIITAIQIDKGDKNYYAKDRAYHERGIFWTTVRVALINFRVLSMARLLDPKAKNYFSTIDIVEHFNNERLKKFYNKRYKKISHIVKQVMAWRGNIIAHRTVISQFGGDFGGGKELQQKDLLKIQKFLFDCLCWFSHTLYSKKIFDVKKQYRREIKLRRSFIKNNVNFVLSRGLGWRDHKNVKTTDNLL